MSFDAGTVTGTLDLDRTPFTFSLEKARTDAANFARKTYEASIGVKGSAETAAELKGVDKQADALDGRDIDIDVDKDGAASAHLGSLSEGFKGLASSIRATKTVLVAAAIPFAIAGLGAGVPTVLGLGASFAGLALNLGRAAAGFGLVAGAATGAAYVGLRAYGALLSRVVSDTREVYLATHQQTAAFIDQQKQQILNTRAAEAFNGEINEMILRFFKLEAAVGREVFPIFTRELQAWQSVFAGLIPVIARTAGTIAGIAAGFARWFRTAQGGQLLARTVGFINSSAIKAAATLSELAATGVMAFQPLIPLASKLQSQILLIVRAADRWTQSAEGQRRLTTIYRDLYNEARRLGPVLLDVGRGVFNVFAAIQQTGVANQASRGLATLAAGFERITRRGTESRRALDAFLNDTRRLMPFVARAVMAFVAQIGRVAGAVIRARQEGSRLTILQSIFRGIERAARPLGNLLIGTFRGLGPEIARLIPNLSRFFETFAGTTGPLNTFVGVLNRALEIFNRLPRPVRTAVANLVALKLILGGLGVGAVIGPMGRFAATMFLTSRAANKVKVAMGLAAGEAATTGGVFARLRGLAGGLRIALGTVAGFLLGLWGVAIAGAVAAGVLIYKNWGQITKAARPLIGAVRGVLKQTLPLARVFGGALLTGIKAIARGFLSAINPSLRLKNASQGLADIYKELAARVLPPLTRAVRGFDSWVRRNRGTLEALGRVVGTVVVGAFKLWIAELRVAVAVLRPLVRAVGFGINIFRSLVGAVTTAAKAIGGAFVGAVGKVKDAWGGLPGWFKQLGIDAVEGFISGFTGGQIAKALAKKIAGALDFIKSKNDGHSPWGSTKPLGKDAALGFLKGWDLANVRDGLSKRVRSAIRDGVVDLGDVPKNVWDRLMAHGWKGDPTDRHERLYRPSSVNLGDVSNKVWNNLMRHGWYGKPGDRAERLYRPTNGSHEGMVQAEDGSWVPKSFYNKTDYRPVTAAIGDRHKGITKDEMREVMHETSDKQLKVIRAAAAQTAGMPEFLRFLDAAMAKGWSHHTNSKPSAV